MLARLKDALKRFWGAAPGSLAGHLNVEEIARIAATALATGGASTVLPGLLSQIGLFVAPQDLALATALVTVIREVSRRLDHGAVVGTAR